MNWREASAAYEAGAMHVWWNLPDWWRNWIIATVENKTELHNVIAEPISSHKPKPRKRKK